MNNTINSLEGNCVAYVRGSKAAYEQQARTIEEWRIPHDRLRGCGHYYDSGSGVDVGSHSGLQRLVAEVTKSGSDIAFVVITSLDRLGRQLNDVLSLVTALERRGVQILIADSPVSLGTK